MSTTAMAGKMNQLLMGLWNEWATQILVLLSLTLQLVLNVLAGIRRRERTDVMRFPLWLAYQLADSTAIYTLGHLSLISRSAPREHNLVAFWAPFLLLHLGGPDSITAYALEDNKLWARHAVTLAIQVLGVVYVLYEHIAGNGRLIVLAAALMFLVGTAKYVERTLALWSANFSSIRNSLKDVPRDKQHHLYIKCEHSHRQGTDHGMDDEFLLQRAHSLFHVCKRGMVDSVIDEDGDGDGNPEKPDTKAIRNLLRGEKYPDGDPSTVTVMQMELSLMYDILYTKANVIHTYLGYGIRTMAPPAVVTSLLLFHFSGKGGHNRVDVPITYALLGGALILETNSLVRSLGSSWALAFLCATSWNWLHHVALCSGRWYRLRRALLLLRRPAMIVTLGRQGSSRKWTLTMKQYSMMCSCARRVNMSSGWFNGCSTFLGLSEWLDRRQCSWNIPAPAMVMPRLHKMLKKVFKKGDLNTMGLLRRKWGKHAMSTNADRRKLYEEIKTFRGVDFHESVLIWHIATEMFLTTRERDPSPNIVEAIRALSNYLMFLFVDRPDMLPGLPQNWLYEQTMKNMVESFRSHSGFVKESSRLKQIKQVAGILVQKYQDHGKSGPKVPRLNYARGVADELNKWKNDEPIDEVLLDLWIDFLIYAANRCNRESHAKRLNNGCEFLTVVWLMVEHYSILENADKLKQSNK
ncbi:hypothetical protein GUJ93_ZPchr0011g27080 [Zizania palustris]|uniref:DUF4220 domain-containing protein n=1 Tax=Zizania palustris TaxID=103762 RepID=A0A8J5WJK7_ZIZPA|nr:hypothetical protein GUJ93_ZPchr0011g27080 [Zizania palustris]